MPVAGSSAPTNSNGRGPLVSGPEPTTPSISTRSGSPSPHCRSVMPASASVVLASTRGGREPAAESPVADPGRRAGCETGLWLVTGPVRAPLVGGEVVRVVAVGAGAAFGFGDGVAQVPGDGPERGFGVLAGGTGAAGQGEQRRAGSLFGAGEQVGRDAGAVGAAQQGGGQGERRLGEGHAVGGGAAGAFLTF